MESHLHHHASGGWLDAVVPAGLLLVAVLYLAAVLHCRRSGRSWPRRRVLWWCAGTVLCLAAVIGPLAQLGHRNFPAHMVGHLLLGMLGPLLLVRAAPVTLLLRVLPTGRARRLVRVLDSPLVRVASHPLFCGTLNLLGLGLLYSTSVFGLSQSRPWLQAVVHGHVLLLGYLFTAAIVGVDPARHRSSYLVRSVILVLFAAGHAILAKRIYAHPPVGVPTEQAERGAMVMYYGGDVVELLVIVLLCSTWYAATAPRPASRPRTHAV